METALSTFRPPGSREKGLGSGVWGYKGLGFRVEGLGVQDLGVQDLGF